jgi:uncharacterized OB-fold protein
MGDLKTRSAHGVEVGDIVRLVVVHPNHDQDRDPVAKVDGVTTFIRFPDRDDGQVQFGDTVQAKIADVQDGHILAVAVDQDGGQR